MVISYDGASRKRRGVSSLSFLKPLERALALDGAGVSGWNGGATFHDRLRRLRCKRVRVVTIGGSRCVGRLVNVQRDYIVLKTKRRRLLIRIESISWVSRCRRRRRRKHCSCCW